jgi:hypothetical protein
MRLDLPSSLSLSPPHHLSLARALSFSLSHTHLPILRTLSSVSRPKVCSYSIANNIQKLNLDAAMSFLFFVRPFLLFLFCAKNNRQNWTSTLRCPFY